MYAEEQMTESYTESPASTILNLIDEIRGLYKNHFESGWFLTILERMSFNGVYLNDIRRLIELQSIYPADFYLLKTGTAALEEFIRSNEYLSDKRGEYTDRNADRTPWEGVFDLNFRLEVFQNVLGRQQSVELTANIFNFSSMLGDVFGTDWGERFIGTSQVNLTQFESFKNPPGENPEEGNPPGMDLTPVYTAQILDVVDSDGDGTADSFRGALGQEEVFNERRTGSTYSSQWQMKVGIRYNF